MSAPVLRVAHLYPRLMNIYGDRGNIICLRRRCEARGIGFELTELGLGDRFDAASCDLVFAGGAQDRDQRAVADDLLATKADALRAAVEDGTALLAVCLLGGLAGITLGTGTAVVMQRVFHWSASVSVW